MNILQVQDALKDFSQEQLVKEMEKPSGQAPQFLVLSELNRRQRMKQDFDARQAQQQPTVAEKLVAAAGAPQGGIGAMAQSMAPQTDMAMNTGVSQMEEPMSGEVMAMQGGGMTSLEEEEDEGFLSGVGNFLGNRYFDDDGSLDYSQAAFDAGLAALSFSPIGLAGRGAIMGARALPGLLRGSAVRSAPGRIGRLFQKGFTKPALTKAGNPLKSGARKFSPLRTAQTAGGAGVVAGILGEDGEPMPPKPEGNEGQGQGQGAGVATGGGEGQETIQDRIMDLMEQRQKSADMDKYLALAQAGFTLMQPTEGGFSEALGKAGVAGIQAYQDASDRYQTGLADVLDTEIALQKANASSDTTIDEINALTKALEEANAAAMMGGNVGVDTGTIGGILMQKIKRLEGNVSPTINVGSLAAR